MRLALIGAGVIGRAHLSGAAQTKDVTIAGIADPSPAARVLAEEFGVAWFPDHHALLGAMRPDGVIVATPNRLHVPIGLECIALGMPVLVEKPIADTVEDGRRLSEAAAQAGVPLLVGHHRRHNPIVRRARKLLQEGALGRLVSVSVLAAVLKADAYFEVPWRRSPGGGPILINQIHEVDVLRFLCGEITCVQAMASNSIRGFPVEDTAVTLLRFDSGVLATITLSDTAAGPWSWTLTAGENAGVPRVRQDSHFICGTEASLALPSLTLWRYVDRRGWDQPLMKVDAAVDEGNPYAEQIRHFAAVIRREEVPVVSGPDATRTLEATLAVVESARLGQPVALAPGASSFSAAH